MTALTISFSVGENFMCVRYRAKDRGVVRLIKQRKLLSMPWWPLHYFYANYTDFSMDATGTSILPLASTLLGIHIGSIWSERLNGNNPRRVRS